MIRAIHVVAEGQTEEEFVRSLMQPYFAAKYGFYDVRAITLNTSPGHKGGDMSFARYQRNVLLSLKRESNILVTSLIDFYKLKTDFPQYEAAKKQNQAEQQVDFLERACAEVVDHDRFVPYIQLHEFEALLFSSKKGFDTYFSNLGKHTTEQLAEIFSRYPNPEKINDGDTTAPSKRLEGIISGYQKSFHGPMIALENGFAAILGKCPRFKAWIELLEKKIQRNG